MSSAIIVDPRLKIIFPDRHHTQNMEFKPSHIDTFALYCVRIVIRSAKIIDFNHFLIGTFSQSINFPATELTKKKKTK